MSTRGGPRSSPHVKNLQQRCSTPTPPKSRAFDQNGDGIISAVEGDVDTASDWFADHSRLFPSPTVFNRFGVTREISDGLLVPRFAPGQRAWILSGVRLAVAPTAGRDADDRSAPPTRGGMFARAASSVLLLRHHGVDLGARGGVLGESEGAVLLDLFGGAQQAA
jgi:hypothetical protein